MKRFIASLVLAASSALVVPLAFREYVSTWCPRNAAGDLVEYSVMRPDLNGVMQKLVFNGTAQAGFCRVAAF